MSKQKKNEGLGIPVLDGTVRALTAAVGRLAEENLMLRGLLESIDVRVEEPDGGVLEIRVELDKEDDEPLTVDGDRAWLAATLRVGPWKDEAAYAAWLRLARELGEEFEELGEGAVER